MERPKAVILARVSSKAQEDEGYSLDSQEKLLRGYCDSKDFQVIKVFKIAETASKQVARKTFHDLLAYLPKNGIEHLIVEKTDRLTRNMRDGVAIDDWLDQDATRRVHAVKENLILHKDAKSDVKFVWNIHLAVAKKFTDNLREEAMKGWAEKLAQGWLPAPPPPGYMTITENGKRIHIPSPKDKRTMQLIFRLYLQPSQNINSITQEMAKRGITTRGGRPIVKSHVQKILMNPFYIGINRFDGKEYPGAQQPIIDKALFQMVQEKLHHGRPTVFKKHNPVFKNIVRCERCGRTVSWQLQRGHYYGACQRLTAECKAQKFLREDTVEKAIIEKLRKLVCPSQEVMEWVASTMREENHENIENAERVSASLKMQIDRLDRMDSQLYDDKLAGDITKEKYDVKHEEFKAQKAEIEAQRDKLGIGATKGLEQRLVILELSQKAAELYATRSPEQKRLIITKQFASISSNDGIVSVTYTNFCRAIAENVFKTTKLLGGEI